MMLQELKWPFKGKTLWVQQGTGLHEKLFFGVACYPEGLACDGIASLMRLDPGTGETEILYEAPLPSPWIEQGGKSRKIGVELGFRAMVVHGEKLYMSLLTLKGSDLLVCDGQNVDKLPDIHVSPPLGPLASFKGYLWGASVGRLVSASAKEPVPSPTLYVGQDPEAGRWEAVPDAISPDAYATPIHHLLPWQGALIVAVGNGAGGFELWRIAGEGGTGEKLLDHGAFRFSLNPAVSSMAVWKDALYLGTGVPETEAYQEREGAEILFMEREGPWKIVTGQPRFSPVGLQRPMTAQGPGWGDPTLNLVSALRAFREDLYMAWVRRAPEGPRGFEIWRMDAGYRAKRVGSRDAGTLRVMVSTSQGLFMGGSRLWRLSGNP